MTVIIEQSLIVTGSLIFLTLGSIHLYYTFFSEKFLPRNAAVETEMRNTSPRLTKETTMWRAWIGFNASHSSGAMIFGLFNLILATQYFDVLTSSRMFQITDIATVCFYLFLARTYWFRVPFVGMLLSSLCFIAAFVLINI